MNPALIETIKSAYFASPRSLGNKFVDKFSSSIGTMPEEKELPISLVALNMTAVCLS